MTKTTEAVWFLKIRSSIDGLKEHTLKSGENTLGRRSENDIILIDEAASGYHAVIEFDQINNTVTIQDLTSTNGTFVNGKRINGLHSLRHEDQIRIGYTLITIIDSQQQFAGKQTVPLARTKVTGELILESIDQYGILLHEIGKKLVNMPVLDQALVEISILIKRMIGAEECHIFLSGQYDDATKCGVPQFVIEQTIITQSATTFSNSIEDRLKIEKEFSLLPHSNLLVPVLIEQNVVALILVTKPRNAINSFSNSDLQLVLAVGNQVAMSIQRNKVEAELIHKSNHDALTDLPNRNLFLERLRYSIERSKRESGFEYAVLFFDIDDFKVVNDGLGHPVGDKFLVAIAERLRHNVRSIDLAKKNITISRFGGDEFAILLDDIGESGFALATANRLVEVLSNPFKIEGAQIFSTASIGVALSSFGYDQPDDILRDADMAMYQAKANGKAQVQIFDASMRNLAIERMRIRTALKEGNLYKDFQLHYQPIVSLQTGFVAGFEALLRWYTPDQGIFDPIDFFSVFDTPELIYSTDAWVLQQACQQVVEWNKRLISGTQAYISVNLSANNLKHPNLLQGIKNILEKTGLAPSQLWLEITEQASAPDDDSAVGILRKLRSTGVRIYFDDFGTGYSSLNYLAKFPVDGLKIDRSFIQMIGVSDDSEKVIEMIITLTNHLGLVVVAEGVETVEQESFLQSLNCKYVQGYYYAKPMDALVAGQYLANMNVNVS